ncbi:MAG TPA: tetratricopeptide repeat protein [Haliangiales bacterium]|nr:tetratricopeptide repeat protein [Haliangiales bacterium]
MRKYALVLLLAAGRAFAQDAATQQLLQEADKYYDAGEYERAASNYDRAIRSQPKDVPPAAYAKRASIYLFQKDYEAGLEWLRTVAEKAWPGDDAILEQKAVVLSRIPARKKEAIELAEKVLRRRPNAYTLHILLGDHYYQLGAGAADKTAAHYADYLKNRPSDLAEQDGLVRVKLGFALLYLGRASEAESQFDEATKATDERIAANARKGQCAAYAGEKKWDRAVTVCERVLADARALRGDPSPHFNLGLAYVNRDRLDDALKAAERFIQARPKDPKGYLLRAQIHLKRNRLADAEAQATLAEQLAPNDPQVTRELGRIYLKQKRAPKAVEKLLRAAAASPNDVDTVSALAEAYLAAGDGQAAAVQAERGLKVPGQEKNTALIALAGEGYYVAGQLPTARATLERGLAAAKAAGAAPDARLKTLLVDTINRQAAARLKADDASGAEKLLLDAREVDPESTRTNFNLGLVAIEKGRWDDAIRYLGVRLQRTPNDLLTNRVIAKAYLGAGNVDKASEHYARAAQEAGARRNNTLLGEINVEWAPLLIQQGKLDDAVERLEAAAAVAAGQPFDKAARRNLAVAYFRRGYERLRGKRQGDPVPDLEGAMRDTSVLTGSEPDVFGFALGLAYLDTGQTARASQVFQGIAKRTDRVPFLRPPFDVIGPDFFAGYTLYREGSTASRAKATTVFEKLLGKASGGLAVKVRDLLRSNWEYTAADAWGRGNLREAETALRKAGGLATGDKRLVVEHDQAVMEIDRNAAAARATFQRLADKVPEALVNLGILADRDGDSRAAYDQWVAARARGARTPRLDEWIEAKKRLFGY